MPKYVVSSTLDKAEWSGSRLIKGNVAVEVRKQKQEPGQDLLLSGSAQLFNALKHEDLIDLYRFMVHPMATWTDADPDKQNNPPNTARRVRAEHAAAHPTSGCRPSSTPRNSPDRAALRGVLGPECYSGSVVSVR
jgi:dihydrofolate reductase